MRYTTKFVRLNRCKGIDAMKFLFLSYDFYPVFGANSYILYNLTQELIHMGHEVHILTLKAQEGGEEEELWNHIFLHRIPYSFNLKQILKFLFEFKFLSAFKLAASILRDYFTRKEYLKQYWSYYSTLRLTELLENCRIDLLINVCYPFESCLPVLNYIRRNGKSVPWIIYMQDPFATNNYYLRKYPQSELIHFQNHVFQIADKIIGTPSIRKELEQNNSELLLQKFKILNFPMIKKQQKTESEHNINFQRNYINCVYVGKFNQVTRNPGILFQIFCLLRNERIRLHILGEKREDWNHDLPETSDNIFFYGYQSKEISVNAELNANILINVGNTVSNQLPSKLLEYISTGKPIVNLYKTEQCPSLEYMDQYPVCFQVSENRIDLSMLMRLRDFCIYNRNIQIPYYYIRSQFYDCTTEYVCNEFIKQCRELVHPNQHPK